jgi:hypothetical protein
LTEIESHLLELVDQLDRIGTANARAVARGVIAGLRDLAAARAPSGDVGRFGDRVIARAAGFEDGDPAALVAALIASGVLVRHTEHRLVLTGWSEIAEDAVHADLARARSFFADGTAPRTRKLPDAERRAAAIWYAEQLGARSAQESAEDAPSKMQLSLFSESSPEISEAEAEEQREGEREREGAAPRAAPTPRRASKWTDTDQRAWISACAAFAAYGMPVIDPTVDRARQRLLRPVLRAYPHRPDVLAEHVHGYMAKNPETTPRWDPLQHLVPETVFGAKRGSYLDAFDRALARGLAPPFVRAGPRRAPAPDTSWTAAARADLTAACAALGDHDRKVIRAQGIAAIEALERERFDLLMRDARECAPSNVVPWRRGARA